MRISDWSSDVCSSDLRLESHGWEVVPLDAVRVEEYVTADKGRRTREIDYQLVQQADQAAELAAYDIVNAREFGPVTLTLKIGERRVGKESVRTCRSRWSPFH